MKISDYRKALNKFERECGCILFEGRRRKAYKVPGTLAMGYYFHLKRLAYPGFGI